MGHHQEDAVIYLSGAVRREYHDAGLGFMVSPAMGNRLPEGATFALDNGVFGAWRRGEDHDPESWLRWLDRQRRDGCLFAVAPDVIGSDCWESFDRSYPYLAQIRSLGFRAALVAQDVFEMLVDERLWDETGGFLDVFDVLFIGGTLICSGSGDGLDLRRRPPGGCDSRILPRGSLLCHVCGADAVEWKETADAAEMMTLAKACGKHVHVGRVNSGRRARAMAALGVDSVDGTYLAFTGPRGLPRVLSWTNPMLPLDWSLPTPASTPTVCAAPPHAVPRQTHAPVPRPNLGPPLS